MEKELTDLIMNPTRMRIIQFMMLHQHGTATEIGSDLSDVSQASIYRNIKILLDAGVLEVISETPVRGTVEKTYAMNMEFGKDVGQQEGEQLIKQALLSILASFDHYFEENPVVDPVKAVICLSSATLLINEEEFMDIAMGYQKLIEPYLNNKPGNGRKERMMTIISSPTITSGSSVNNVEKNNDDQSGTDSHQPKKETEAERHDGLSADS